MNLNIIFFSYFLIFLAHQSQPSDALLLPSPGLVPGPDVHLATLLKRLEYEADPAKRNDLIHEIRHILIQKKSLDQVFDILEVEIRNKAGPSERNSKVNFACYRKLMNQFNEHCDFVASSPYVGEKVTLFYNTCKGLFSEATINRVSESVAQVCERTRKSRKPANDITS